MTILSKSNGGRRVLVIQRRLTHYRVPFFQSLKAEFSNRGIDFCLAHGEPTKAERAKDDEGFLPWAEQLSTWYGMDGRLCWLGKSQLLASASVAVLTPENKMLSNLPQQYFGMGRRIVLWGHGANLQGTASSLRERFKRVVARQTDWWFGYTDMSIPLIGASGFPCDRITVLNNAVDTRTLSDQFVGVSEQTKHSLRSSLGLKGRCVGVYVGSLYNEKRVPFMLQAAEEIHRELPDFEFLIVGGGPDKNLVETFCQKNSWARYLGVKKGQDKVDVLALGTVMINPGLVGLGILDSFVCGVPMVTTDCGLHSPEIAYLKDGENGLMTANTINDYVTSVVGLLSNDEALVKLRAGCAASAKEYTIENMARNFADGVIRCLEAPMYRRRSGA